jgi:hypothetical protein
MHPGRNLASTISIKRSVAANNPNIIQPLQALAVAMSARIGGNKQSERRAAGIVATPQSLYSTDPAKPGEQTGNPKTKLK